MPKETLPIKIKPESATLTELLHPCQSDLSHLFRLCSSQGDQTFDIPYSGNRSSLSLPSMSQFDATYVSQILHNFSESLRFGFHIRAIDLAAD